LLELRSFKGWPAMACDIEVRALLSICAIRASSMELVCITSNSCRTEASLARVSAASAANTACALQALSSKASAILI
jgi:hypothetical protein